MDQGAAYCSSLAFAAGEFSGAMIEAVAEADFL